VPTVAVADIEVSGEPDWAQSWFVNGIKHLPCRCTPALLTSA